MSYVTIQKDRGVYYTHANQLYRKVRTVGS